MKSFIAIVLVLISVGCTSIPTGPNEPEPIPTLYIPILSATLTEFDVARWDSTMTAPQVIIPDAYIYGPPAKGKVVVVRRSEEGSSLLVANDDGSDQRVVSTMKPFIFSASLSPNGRYIAYAYGPSSLDRQAVPTIEIIPIDGGEPLHVIKGVSKSDQVRWSPVLNLLAYVQGISLMVVSAEDDQPKNVNSQFTPSGEEYELWQWSMDGVNVLRRFSDGVRIISTITDRDTTFYPVSPGGVVYTLAGSQVDRRDLYYGVLSGSRSHIAFHQLKIDSLTYLSTFPSKQIPYFLTASPRDEYISFTSVTVYDHTPYPPPMRSPIKVLRRSDNTVIDLGVSGGKGHWR